MNVSEIEVLIKLMRFINLTGSMGSVIDSITIINKNALFYLCYYRDMCDSQKFTEKLRLNLNLLLLCITLKCNYCLFITSLG